ncbi:MAG: hypothetical protein HQL24_00340 [Candidatus Omnitrophica bacterium]|nr:hypothetical protein [Candidatus Omnitrophota bacterium]
MTMPKLRYHILFIFLWVLIGIVNCLRFYNLEDVPKGFHVDELSSATTIQCLATEGRDARGNKPDVFLNLGYGTPKPPTYIYPGILWTKIFGYSIASFHGYTAFAYTLFLIGLFFLSRRIFPLFIDNRQATANDCSKASLFAALTTLAASLSPWSWPVSRVAFESIFTLAYLIWGLYFFFKSNRTFSMMMAGFLLSCAMYTYPPTRAQVPLMLIPLIFLRHKQFSLTFKGMAAFFSALMITSVPLALKIIFDKSLLNRFRELSIFSKTFLESQGKTGTFADIVGIFLNGFKLHFSPYFLFGSASRHSTLDMLRCFGILGWLDVLGLLCGLGWIVYLCFRWKNKEHWPAGHIFFIVFCVVNIMIGFVPSALTGTDIPNVLRIIGALPFMMLLTGFFLYKTISVFSPMMEISSALALIFAIVFLRSYFLAYPNETQGLFSIWSKGEALAAKSEDDWVRFLCRHSSCNFHAIYYLMNYKKGETCQSARTKWEFFYNYALKHKVQ